MKRAVVACLLGFGVLSAAALGTAARADDTKTLMGYRLTRTGLATKAPRIDILIDSAQIIRLLPQLQQMEIFKPTLTPADVSEHLHRTVATYCFVVAQAALNTTWPDTKASEIRVGCAGQYGKQTEPVFSATYDRQLAPKLAAGMETVDFMISAKIFTFSPAFHAD